MQVNSYRGSIYFAVDSSFDLLVHFLLLILLDNFNALFTKDVGAIGDKKEDGLYYRLHMIERTHAEALVCCRRKPKWRLAIMRTAATFEVFKDFQRKQILV